MLHELFAATGDIRASDSELHITLAPLSSPHRILAQALCQTLDQTATIFPGSRLRVRFSVRPPSRIGLAFRFASRAQHRRGCSAGSLIDAKTGHFALPYVRRPEAIAAVG
jgi:hypothetical protein